MKGKGKARKEKFAVVLREQFDFDVETIEGYVDETAEEVISDLVLGANLVGRVSVEQGVKGSKKLKLMNISAALQSALGCGKTPNGVVEFTDRTIEAIPVKVDLSVCNSDLRSTWAQMLLELGVRAEREQLPLEEVITAYVVKLAQAKNQRLMWRGDVDSIDPDLVFYDGYVKLLTTTAGVVEVIPASTGAMDVTNAFGRFQKLANAIDPVLADNGITVEIACSRADAQLVLNNIYNDKDYAAIVKTTDTGGELSFVLPTTNVTVRSYPDLISGEVFAVPYRFMFFGTDLEGDIADFWLFFNDLTEKLYFGSAWASGVQIVIPKYFARLRNYNS
jgi:hypothetical protein